MKMGCDDEATGHHGSHCDPTLAESMHRMRIWWPLPEPGSYWESGDTALPGQGHWALETAGGSERSGFGEALRALGSCPPSWPKGSGGPQELGQR